MNGTAETAHLLVVDDDARLRDLLQRFLTEQGFRVTAVADAAVCRLLQRREGVRCADVVVRDRIPRRHRQVEPCPGVRGLRRHLAKTGVEVLPSVLGSRHLREVLESRHVSRR